MWLYGLEPLKLSHHPAKFGGHRHCDHGDMILICHVISQNHVIKDQYNYVGKSLSS